MNFPDVPLKSEYCKHEDLKIVVKKLLSLSVYCTLIRWGIANDWNQVLL